MKKVKKLLIFFSFFILALNCSHYADAGGIITFEALDIGAGLDNDVPPGETDRVIMVLKVTPSNLSCIINTMDVVFTEKAHRNTTGSIKWWYSPTENPEDKTLWQTRPFEDDNKTVLFDKDFPIMASALYFFLSYSVPYTGLYDTDVVDCWIESPDNITVSDEWEKLFLNAPLNRLNSRGSDIIQIKAVRYESLISLVNPLNSYSVSQSTDIVKAGQEFYLNMFCLDEYNNIDIDGKDVGFIGRELTITSGAGMPAAAPNGTPNIVSSAHIWTTSDKGVYSFPIILYTAHNSNRVNWSDGLWQSFTDNFIVKSGQADSYSGGSFQVGPQTAGVPFFLDLIVTDKWLNLVDNYIYQEILVEGVHGYEPAHIYSSYKWIEAGKVKLTVRIDSASDNRRIKVRDFNGVEALSGAFKISPASFKEVVFAPGVMSHVPSVLSAVPFNIQARDDCGNIVPTFAGDARLFISPEAGVSYPGTVSLVNGISVGSESLFFISPGIYTVTVENDSPISSSSSTILHVSPIRVELNLPDNDVLVGDFFNVRVDIIIEGTEEICVNFQGRVRFAVYDENQQPTSKVQIPISSEISGGSRRFNVKCTAPGNYFLSAVLEYPGLTPSDMEAAVKHDFAARLNNKLDSFKIETPVMVEPEKPFEITLKAMDAYGNNITNWSGEIKIGVYRGTLWVYDESQPVSLMNIYSEPADKGIQTVMAGGIWRGRVAVSAESLTNGIYVEAQGVRTLQSRFFEQEIKHANKSMNYPNPFNPMREATTVRYFLDSNSDIDIKIYTLTGRQVRSWSFRAGQENASQGLNFLSWDGRDEAGNLLSSGGYICSIWKNGLDRSGVSFSKKKADTIKIAIILDR